MTPRGDHRRTLHPPTVDRAPLKKEGARARRKRAQDERGAQRHRDALSRPLASAAHVAHEPRPHLSLYRVASSRSTLAPGTHEEWRSSLAIGARAIRPRFPPGKEAADVELMSAPQHTRGGVYDIAVSNPGVPAANVASGVV